MPIKQIFILIFTSCVIFSTAFAEPQPKEINPLESFKKEDRVLIFAPHPDDETIGCAGVIQRALSNGAKVKVIYLTSGDNNIFSILFYNQFLFPIRLLLLNSSDFITLGRQRQKEAIEAMKILGLKENDLAFLGYPDHGTDRMFVFNWGRKKPYKSLFNDQSAVPYEESMSYKKEFKADNILEDIEKILLDYKPTKIFISHPADLNGDHWALYLYVQVALADLDKKIPDPKVYPYIVHVTAWPLPRHYHPDLRIEPPKKFFEDSLEAIGWTELKLTPQELEKKHEAMLAYRSQTRISAFYLLSFVRQNELFGDFPMIELKKKALAKDTTIKLGEQDIFTSDSKWFGLALVDNYLLIKAKKPKELKNRAAFIFFLDVYKIGAFFGDLPDIIITTKYDKFRVYDANIDKYIDPKDTSLEFNPDSIVLKVPLSILEDPDGFIFALDTYNDFLPLGVTSFREVILE
ncbi:MAG: PIG-L family deacetylase [Candidatus Omnitrophica bacterium]|nr:PIG-L family deacetylase [Candidatus Omnitrophota bacterium]